MSSLMQASPPIHGRMRRCILLLAGAAGDGGVRSGLVVQNLLYVLAKKTGDGVIEGRFEPGELGPHSEEAAGELGPHSEEAAGELGRMAGGGLASIGRGGRIAATPAGRAAARDAGDGLGKCARAVIAGHVPFLNDMTDEELVLYMHLEHPCMSAGSRACAALACRTEDIVMGMVRNEKVSSGRAGEVMGVPFREVLSMMKRHGIPNLR